MLSLTSTQLQNTYKSIIWLFDITDKDNNTYYWSTRDYTYNSTTYSFNITGFSGISLNRSRSEENIVAPSEVRIEIGNVDNTYSADDFTDGTVLISLLVDDTLIAKWKFDIVKAYGKYQTITLECEDFLQKYLEGAYPNTQLVKALFPDNYYEDEDLCIPVCFGTAYIPLRPVEIDGARYYMLGPTDRTYTIEEVHTPSEWGIKQTWSSSEYSFNQYTKTDQFGNSWRVFQPIIADSDLDGTADACGIWIRGQKILDMPTKFSYNSTTNPADVIKTILKDFGVPDSEIDDDSFTSAASTFDTWGLAWNGGFWKKSDRHSILATLLNSCHARILVRDKLVLSVLSKSSQKTVTSSLVLKESFDYSKLTEGLTDSGYVAWQKEGEPQDNLLKALVPGKGTTTDHIGSDTIFIPWVQNAIHVQKLACLAFQRKFFKIAQISFSGRSELLALEPGDVITISGDNYGGEYQVIVDFVQIDSNLSVHVMATEHSIEFDDWDDLTQFSDITVYTTVPSAWETLPSGYGYGLRWDRDQATLFVEGTVRVTGGFIADVGGFFRSGQTAFDTGVGFWIGSDNGTPKLSIGDSSGAKLTWDGLNLNVFRAAIKTSSSGARVEIFPSSNVGIIAYDDNGSEVFKVMVGGEDVGDVILGNYASNQGCKWDKSEGKFYIRGQLDAGDLVSGTISASRFAAKSITADKLSVNQLDSVSVWTGTLVVDEAIHSPDKLSFTSPDAGFWLGNDSGTYKFVVGNSSSYFQWDGSDVTIHGGKIVATDAKLGDTDVYVHVGDPYGLHQIVFTDENYFPADRAVISYTETNKTLSIEIDGVGAFDFKKEDEHISYLGISPADLLSNLGTSTWYWDDVYYCTLHAMCSLSMIEEVADPLALIRQIKVDPKRRTVDDLPKADYSTLPKFLTSIKYADLKKEREGFEDHLNTLLERGAEITYEDDEKVAVKTIGLNINTTISLLLAAIRKLIQMSNGGK